MSIRTFGKNVFIALLAAVVLFTVCACSKNDDAGNETETLDTAIETTDTAVETTETAAEPSIFADEDLTAGEIEVLEKITGREFTQITESDLSKIEALNIVGSNVTKSEYLKSFSRDGYSYMNKMYPYENDIGEHLSVLKYFVNLKSLGIYFCESLTDVSFLESLVNLEELTVTMSGAADFTAVEKLDKLTSLEIRCTPIDTIAFSDTASVKYVYIDNGNLSSLKPFEKLTEVECLSVIYNHAELGDTEVIAGMKNLRTLELIAPSFDIAFMSEMVDVPILSLVLGGYDGIDLTVAQPLFGSLGSFQLRNSNGTDLTPLDELPANCDITVVMSENCISGARTQDGAEKYRSSSTSYDMFDWYYEK